MSDDTTQQRDPQTSALLASHGMLSQQIGQVGVQLATISTRLSLGDERMTRIETALAENTVLTRDFARARDGARALRTVMVWAGGIAGGAVGIYQLAKIIITGGGDIGPTP